MKKLSELEKNININFKDKVLLATAFTHRSYLNENKSFKLISYEKLEFLGDSVLSLVTSVYLFKNYPQLQEGDYTEIKSAMVRTGSLAQVSQNLKLGDYLFLSKGEELSGGRKNKNILADCFEALIAVIFIDKGFKKAYDFITKYLFKEKLEMLIKEKLYQSAKSMFQELVQARYKTTPQYKILAEKGPEHKRVFKVGLFLNGQKLSEGIGGSKKEAEELAAQEALLKKR